MDFLIGIALALGVGIFAALVGLDRERAFYSTVLIVVASYYLLFAAMGASAPVLRLEILLFVPFALLAVIGFRNSEWWIAAGLVAHGIFDFLRVGHISNPGVPGFWPDFCMGFDVFAGAWLAALIVRRGRERRDASSGPA